MKKPCYPERVTWHFSYTKQFFHSIGDLSGTADDEISSIEFSVSAVAVAAANGMQTIADSGLNIVEPVADDDERTLVERSYFAENFIFRDKVVLFTAIEIVEEPVESENSAVSLHVVYAAVAEENEGMSHFFQFSQHFGSVREEFAFAVIDASAHIVAEHFPDVFTDSGIESGLEVAPHIGGVETEPVAYLFAGEFTRLSVAVVHEPLISGAEGRLIGFHRVVDSTVVVENKVSHYASISLMRLIISIAPSAHSLPLLPALEPARSIACSMFSVVITPNITGISLLRET